VFASQFLSVTKLLLQMVTHFGTYFVMIFLQVLRKKTLTQENTS